jgi:hypothetical protein
MATPFTQYPLINGHRISRSSTDLIVYGVRCIGWKSWSSSADLTPGEMHGNKVKIQGRTRGKLKLTLSIEFYREEYDSLIIPAVLARGASLGIPGAGYMEIPGDILLTAFEPGTPIGALNILAEGARIMKDADSVGDNDDALTVKVDFSITDLLRNAISPASDRIGI